MWWLYRYFYPKFTQLRLELTRGQAEEPAPLQVPFGDMLQNPATAAVFGLQRTVKLSMDAGAY